MFITGGVTQNICSLTRTFTTEQVNVRSTQSDDRNLPSGSASVERIFILRCRAKQTAELAWFGKGSEACDCVELLSSIGKEMTMNFIFRVLDPTVAKNK